MASPVPSTSADGKKRKIDISAEQQRKKREDKYFISNFTSGDIYNLLEEVSGNEDDSSSDLEIDLGDETLEPQDTQAGSSYLYSPSSPTLYQTLTPIVITSEPDLPPPVTLSEISQHLLSTGASDSPQPYVTESPQPSIESEVPSTCVPWSSTAPNHSKIPFTGSSKLLCDLQGHDPFDFFNLYFTNDLFELVVRETNLFAEELFLRSNLERARITDWKYLDVDELKKFLGIMFLMGIIKLNRIHDYWTTDEMFNFTYISSRMSRDRFLSIRQTFHLAKSPMFDNTIHDPLYKIRPILDHFHRRTEDLIYPDKHLCIDESMSLWRSRISFRQYTVQKRHKHSMKFYMLTEPNGPIHRFLIYAGSQDPEVSGQGHAAKIVNKLVKDFKGSGHSLYMGRFYNSVPLARELKDQKVLLSGTLCPDRKENPREIVTAKLKKGEMVQRWSTEGINVCKWKDKRDVLMISTEHSGKMISTKNRHNVKVTKPEVVVHYNKHMGGVDRVDQLLSYYSSSHQSLKWYKKLTFHIIEMMMLNSYFLYRSYSKVKKRVDLYNFRIQIIKNLCGPRPLPFTPRPRSRIIINRGHYATQHLTLGNPPVRKKQQKCRICHKKTTWYCPDCEGCPGLCQQKECFLTYHEKQVGFQMI